MKKRMFFIMIIGLLFCNFHLIIAQTWSTYIWEPFLTLKTPNGKTVQDTYTLTSGEIYFSQGELTAYEATIKSYGAELIELPTAKYNCHGYAWSVSEGGPKYGLVAMM